MNDTAHRIAAVRIELKAGADPVSGWVTGPDGVREAFRGWMELTEAIERHRCRGLRGTPSDPPAAP
jgi:hypothetical protein